jgi:carbohydrate kinase (thermoresistant glucokinase family)
MMRTTDNSPRLVLLMGVAGSGKTTLGKLLAERLSWTFVDADDFHTDEAIARMRSGITLGDSLRDAWIDRLELALRDLHRQRVNCVVAFSGLRARHRQQLMRIGFVTSAFMLTGSAPLLSQRIGQRADHFMPLSQLQDQLERMEEPQRDEGIERVDIGALPGDIVEALAAKVLS